MKKCLFIIIATLLPGIMHAQNTYVPLAKNAQDIGITSGVPNIAVIVDRFFRVGLSILGLLAVIMITIGGIKYMGSNSVFGKDDGKKQIQAAIGGLILGLGAWLLLNTINPQLVATRFTQIQFIRDDNASFVFDGSSPGLNNQGVGQPINHDGTIGPTDSRGLGTHYYYVDENQYGSGNVAIRDSNGNVIARVSQAYFDALEIEGSGLLRDGRYINIAGNTSGVYSVVNAPLGNRGNELQPFRSVAVDQNLVPFGSLIYVAQTDGMLLPDGTRHNGIWRADDVGSAINNNDIDFYVGPAQNRQFLRDANVSGSGNVDFVVLRSGQ